MFTDEKSSRPDKTPIISSFLGTQENGAALCGRQNDGYAARRPLLFDWPPETDRRPVCFCSQDKVTYIMESGVQTELILLFS